MPTHVYANGREIACQAADGIASPAFPDPCWTPPPPPAGPVVIPYANTARPKTLKKGSRKVFIGGKPVALGDRSYFSTSIGDEPATHVLSKGVMSGVIKGKAYFRSWSMNVIIEGHGVARHLDRMTHNHGSNPANTPPFPYLARAWKGKSCEEDNKRVEDHCGPDGNLTKKHCADFQRKAHGLDGGTAYAEMDGVRTRLSEELEEKKDLALFEGLDGDFEKLKKQMGDLDEKSLVSDDTKRKKIRKSQTLTAEGQGMLATLNDCLRARKCKLVSYESQRDNAETANPTKSGQTQGCCKGQTGHHLIPEAMVNGGYCKNYDHNEAPVVCVEGVNHSQGTHGRVHSKLDEIVLKIAKQGYLEVDGKPKKLGADGKMDLKLAVEAAATSHAKAFPKSGCSRNCIKAQLNEYYGKACGSTGRFATVKKFGKPRSSRVRKPKN